MSEAQKLTSRRSLISGFVYPDTAPSFDRQRFVLALPKVRSKRTCTALLKAHGVPHVLSMSDNPCESFHPLTHFLPRALPCPNSLRTT